ncbi:hypothetical protein BC830DRAFT_6804 [Chytriomyces sp. MP71]|nr:hypothetical protein BC830DRAFT_6804 [Chytriomyces sp. MP71]
MTKQKERHAGLVRDAMIFAMNETLAEAPCATTAVLLSGGLDTSIITDAANARDPRLLAAGKPGTVASDGFVHAVTLSVDTDPISEEDGTNEDATINKKPWLDLPYALAIARRYPAMRHHVVKVTDPMETLMRSDTLVFCIRTLNTFDPMELRGGVALAHAMIHAKSLGIDTLVTGDSADELFAGYSFLTGLSDVKLRKWIKRYVGNSSFSAVPMGNALGMRVIQPYLHQRVIDVALQCNKDDLVGPDPMDPALVHGKYVLRVAFPEAASQWRKKIPLETGAGTTPIGEVFTKSVEKEWLSAQMDEVYTRYGIVIRDAEHLHYFRVFEKLFAEHVDNPAGTDAALSVTTQTNTDPTLERFARPTRNVRWTTSLPRFGADPCVKCGFELDRADQYFCKTCGAWPARAGGIPQDTEEDE